MSRQRSWKQRLLSCWQCDFRALSVRILERDNSCSMNFNFLTFYRPFVVPRRKSWVDFDIFATLVLFLRGNDGSGGLLVLVTLDKS